MKANMKTFHSTNILKVIIPPKFQILGSNTVTDHWEKTAMKKVIYTSVPQKITLKEQDINIMRVQKNVYLKSSVKLLYLTTR